MASTMIATTIERWHAVLRGELAFEDVLHEDCTFWSPVLFRPMEGRDLTAEHVTLLDTDIDELKTRINNIKDQLLTM